MIETSESFAQLATDLAKAQGEFPVVTKSKTATIKTDKGGYEYKFADLGDIVPEILPVLSKHNLSVIQPPTLDAGTIFIETWLMHASGEWIKCLYPVASYTQTSHQKIGSALTYARRYALCSLLCIVSEEDLDAQDETAGQVREPQRQSKAAREPAQVVQGSKDGGKPLPPKVGANGEKPTYTFTDRYGEMKPKPLWEGDFVEAVLQELKECTVYDALGEVLTHNEKQFKTIHKSNQDRIHNLYTQQSKALRRELKEGAPEA